MKKEETLLTKIMKATGPIKLQMKLLSILSQHLSRKSRKLIQMRLEIIVHREAPPFPPASYRAMPTRCGYWGIYLRSRQRDLQPSTALPSDCFMGVEFIYLTNDLIYKVGFFAAGDL